MANRFVTGASEKGRVKKSEYSTVFGSCSGTPRRKMSPNYEQARVLSCKTWSFEVLDDRYGPEDESTGESFSHMHRFATDEVKPKTSHQDLPGLGKEQSTTITSEGVLSAHTDMTNPASLDLNLDHTKIKDTLDTTTPQHDIKAEQTCENTMAPLKAKRIKYKEPALVLSSPEAPSATEEPLLASTELNASQHEKHMPTHSSTPNELSPPDESSPSPAHNNIDITPSRITERKTSTEVTPEAAKALVPYSSSSSEESDHIPQPSRDSAVDMANKKEGHRRKQQNTTGEDQEVVFRGRRSVEASNATNDSWRYDATLSALVSNTGGASYRPALASKTSNQKVGSTPKESGASTAHGRSEPKDSLWAREPTANAPDQQNDWKATGDNGWDTEHPPLSSKNRANATNATSEQAKKEQSRAPSRPFNHNGRVRIDEKRKKPRESPWIKDSLIPKGDPNRHKARWSSPSGQSSSFDSDRASSGWGTRRKRGQYDNGADLTDWAGGLGPASIDWDSRSQFRDHQSTAKIETWLSSTYAALEHVEQIKLINGGNTFSFAMAPSGTRELVEQEQGDIAPRYWFLSEIDGNSAALFWLVHIETGANGVQLVDEGDHKDAEPWWNNYLDDSHSMLKPLVHPEIAGNDPDESEKERLAREHDNGGANAGANRKAAEKAKRDAQRKRTLAKRDRAHKFSGMYNLNQSPPSSNAIKLGLNMFLRSAMKEDMVRLRDIYNRYIDNAFVVPETERLTEDDMLERWQAIKGAKLPFLVACERGEVIKARNKKVNGGEDMVMPDKVVGFACAADWSDGKCIYRPTVKLEVFVHMEQYMKNIGSCLADKMMGLLDPRFIERGGYDTVGEELEAVEPSRAISNVLVHYSYEADKTDKLLWTSKWLKKRFGFAKVADLKGIAEKFGKQ
jgi:L-amino acid N-acyltransferase YncA